MYISHTMPREVSKVLMSDSHGQFSGEPTFQNFHLWPLPPHKPGEDAATCWQCVAVCCSVLQCVADSWRWWGFLAVCCSVLQCVAVFCSMLQCFAVCCSVLQTHDVDGAAFSRIRPEASSASSCCSVLQRVAACCSVLQRVAAYCSVLECCSVLQYIETHGEDAAAFFRTRRAFGDEPRSCRGPMCDTTHSYVRRDSLKRVTWLVHTCGRDWFMRDLTCSYGVALVSRID